MSSCLFWSLSDDGIVFDFFNVSIATLQALRFRLAAILSGLLLVAVFTMALPKSPARGSAQKIK